jgi:hypothetical protein
MTARNTVLSAALAMCVGFPFFGCNASTLSSVFKLNEEKVTVQKGTTLKVRTVTTLSTKSHENGDAFDASLAAPLVVDGATVAPQGANVRGVVVEADKGGRAKGRAHLAVRLTELQTATGGWVDIDTLTVVRQAPGSKGKDAAKIGIGSGVGAAIGAIAGGGKGAAIGAGAGAGAGTGTVLATRGKQAVIPGETVLTFQLSAPIETKAFRAPSES